MEEKFAVSYCRVSTVKQGKSGKGFGQGLSLTAQKERNKLFIEQSNYTCLAEFVETESGRNPNRPKITEAIEICKQKNATLIVATISRLAREQSLIVKLRDNNVRFIIATMPEANELTVDILMAMASNEVRNIRANTKIGIGQSPIYKDGKWGNPQNFTSEGRREGAKTNKNKALAFWAQKKNYLMTLRNQRKTYAEIAAILNDDGYFSRAGKKIYAITVQRQCKRMNID